VRKLQSILIIDDDEVNNFICSKIIEEERIANKITTTLGVDEALEYINKGIRKEASLPDLILLDLNMPVLTGWDFLDRYQKLERELHKEIVLVILSSSAFQDDIKKAKTYKAVSAYKTKPITKQLLTEIRMEYFEQVPQG
jgi:CheY-like chemotaxis protein